MSNYTFKKACEEYANINRNFKNEQIKFETDVERFMREKHNIPIKVLFFGNTFGIDIKHSWDRAGDLPFRLSLQMIVDISDEFGCEFLETCCDGSRCIFKFDNSCGY